ncbi:MAG: nucleotidyltransferase [Actinobacteria bacterium]|nr:nucleotidyltransferase [Actinomycetota bacterium]
MRHQYERSAIERSVRARLEGREVNVLTTEDLIVCKLVAGRARDYEAVAAIINARRKRLDESYIRGWLEQFNLDDAWQRAIEEAERERD